MRAPVNLLSDSHTPDPGESDPVDTYHVSVPVQLKRCGIETKLIVPGQGQPGAVDLHRNWSH